MDYSDIQKFGAGQGIGFYWIRAMGGSVGNRPAQYTRLVSIDEVGNVTSTPLCGPDNAAAMSEQEAVELHLSDAIDAADALLEKRAAELEEDPAPPEPTDARPDPATERFLHDPDY